MIGRFALNYLIFCAAHQGEATAFLLPCHAWNSTMSCGLKVGVYYALRHLSPKLASEQLYDCANKSWFMRQPVEHWFMNNMNVWMVIGGKAKLTWSIYQSITDIRYPVFDIWYMISFHWYHWYHYQCLLDWYLISKGWNDCQDQNTQQKRSLQVRVCTT